MHNHFNNRFHPTIPIGTTQPNTDYNSPTNTLHTTDQLSVHLTQMSLIFNNTLTTKQTARSLSLMTLSANMNSSEHDKAGANSQQQNPIYYSVLKQVKTLKHLPQQVMKHTTSSCSLTASTPRLTKGQWDQTNSQHCYHSWQSTSLSAGEATHQRKKTPAQPNH